MQKSGLRPTETEKKVDGDVRDKICPVSRRIDEEWAEAREKKIWWKKPDEFRGLVFKAKFSQLWINQALAKASSYADDVRAEVKELEKKVDAWFHFGRRAGFDFGTTEDGVTSLLYVFNDCPDILQAIPSADGNDIVKLKTVG